MRQAYPGDSRALRRGGQATLLVAPPKGFGGRPPTSDPAPELSSKKQQLELAQVVRVVHHPNMNNANNGDATTRARHQLTNAQGRALELYAIREGKPMPAIESGLVLRFHEHCRAVLIADVRTAAAKEAECARRGSRNAAAALEALAAALEA